MSVSHLFDISGKTAIVTGASFGIGRMLADGLADAGARVYIVGRNADDLQTVVEAMRSRGGDAHALPADLSDQAEVTRLAQEYASREDSLDILVNNVGAMVEASLEEFTREDWDHVVHMCMGLPFFLAQALMPQLRASASPDDPARIINIGSADGIKAPFLSTYPYPAAKAGVHHLTKQMARELGPEGISVNAIAPGAFPSRRADPVLEVSLDDFLAATPLRRIGRPDDMAGTIVYMTSRAGSYLNGAVLSLDGGLTT